MRIFFVFWIVAFLATGVAIGGESLPQQTPSGNAPSGAGAAVIHESQPQSLWPLPNATEWYWYEPAENLSLPEAEAALKEYKEIEVYLSSLKRGGVVNEMMLVVQKKKPASITCLTTASGPALPVTITVDATLKEMRLGYSSAQDAGKKWLVLLDYDFWGKQQFYFDTQGKARRFMDILASLRKLADLPALPRDRFGFRTLDLTPAQADALGKSRIENALVSVVYSGGPAEAAGVNFLDLITAVNGVKVRNAGHLDSILSDTKPGAPLRLSCLERSAAVNGDAKTRAWKPKVVEMIAK